MIPDQVERPDPLMILQERYREREARGFDFPPIVRVTQTTQENHLCYKCGAPMKDHGKRCSFKPQEYGKRKIT